MQNPNQLVRRIHMYTTTYLSDGHCFQSCLPFEHCGESDILNVGISKNILVSWSKSSYESIKINFDAAIQDNTIAIAYIFFDSNTNLICSVGRPLHYSSVSYAEIVAAWLGLSEVVSFSKTKKVFLEGDFAYTINVISSLCKHTN